MRGLGYLPDLPDDRDQKLSAKLGALAVSPPPSSASVERPEVGPKDQEHSSSCAGNAFAQAYRLACLFRGIACPELSALFPYFMSRAEYGEQLDDSGTYIRTVIKASVRSGIPDEEAWPFSMQAVNRNPNMFARQSAFDRRGVRSYSRANNDPNEFRRAIASGHPVIAGWMVDQDFTEWDGRGVISAQDKPIGGHAMCVSSYAADGTFRLLNSWGTGYGRAGFAVVDESFIAQASDAWVVEVLP